MQTLKLPARFVFDSMARDIIDYREPVTASKTYVWLPLTDDEIDALRADAEYYRDEAREFGPEYAGLCKSAAAVVRWIDKGRM